MGFYQNILNNKARLALADFLNFEFVNKNAWFFNVWSIVHFLSGGLLMFLLLFFGLGAGARWIIFLVLILGWEFLEIVLSLTTDLFILEGFRDMMWDIILALIAAGIIELVFFLKN